MKKNILDLVVIGSGLSGLNFADEYSRSGKKINIISYVDENILDKNTNHKVKFLPIQMRGKNKNVENYFNANNLKVGKDCKVLGALDFGGLSNYWGLQIDNYINNDQEIGKKSFSLIESHFLNFLKKYNLIGSFYKNKKLIYKKEFNIPEQLKSLIKEKDKNFVCKKPILGFMGKEKFKGNLNKINEIKDKLNSINFLNKIKNNKKLVFHNFFVQKISKNKSYIEITCKNKKVIKKFLVKKLVLASGTIITTKLLADYLNIKSEIKINHHPRLLSVFISKKPIKFNMNFTPSILQIIKKSKQDYYSADLRPGNKLITDSIIEAFPFMSPFKTIINFFRHRTIFSNILLDTKHSNIYMKKTNENFKIYCKQADTKNLLKKRNKKIYKFLLTKKIIFPFFYSVFPGAGADYHYFGSIPFNKKKKLSVNDKCQLKGTKNIYIVDGSVFNFKTNKYPLGIVIANARRIGEYLSNI
jgi:hypothetical protein